MDEAFLLSHKEDEDWAAHLISLRRKLKKQGLSDNSCKSLTGALRGYFRHVGIQLELLRSQREELVEVGDEDVTKDYQFNLKAKEALLKVATDELDEYILTAGVSFGLRVGDFTGITRGLIEEALARGEDLPIQLSAVTTKKKKVPAYPFIDKDSLPAIKRLLKRMDSEGRTSPDEKMVTLSEGAVNDRLRGLFKAASVPTYGRRVRFHTLRKFLTDQLAGVCSTDKWKFFVGKATKEDYVQAEGKRAYSKVMDLTCVNGNKVKEGGRMISEEDYEALQMFKAIRAGVRQGAFKAGPLTKEGKERILDTIARTIYEQMRKEKS